MKKLLVETKKQLAKIEKIRPEIEIKNKKGKEILRNIDAYISDCKHFLRRKKMIEAFEAIIWAWAWLEIYKELKILKQKV